MYLTTWRHPQWVVDESYFGVDDPNIDPVDL